MGHEDFVKDTRSHLAKLLDSKPKPFKRLEGFEGGGGRFRGVPLAVIPLSGEAMELATVEAVKHLTAIGHIREDLYTEIGEGVFSWEIKAQLLARSLQYIGAKDELSPFAFDASEIRSLETDEVSALYEHFLIYQDERSPISKARSWAQVEDELEAMGKGWTDGTSLNRYDANSLRFMLRELAVQHWKQTKLPSSDISPSPDTAEPSSPT